MSTNNLEKYKNLGIEPQKEPRSFAFFLDKAKYPKPKKEGGDEEVEKEKSE